MNNRPGFRNFFFVFFSFCHWIFGNFRCIRGEKRRQLISLQFARWKKHHSEESKLISFQFEWYSAGISNTFRPSKDSYGWRTEVLREIKPRFLTAKKTYGLWTMRYRRQTSRLINVEWKSCMSLASSARRKSASLTNCKFIRLQCDMSCEKGIKSKKPRRMSTFWDANKWPKNKLFSILQVIDELRWKLFNNFDVHFVGGCVCHFSARALWLWGMLFVGWFYVCFCWKRKKKKQVLFSPLAMEWVGLRNRRDFCGKKKKTNLVTYLIALIFRNCASLDCPGRFSVVVAVTKPWRRSLVAWCAPLERASADSVPLDCNESIRKWQSVSFRPESITFAP